MVTQQKKLAILVGGGPAPGINSVISAATAGVSLREFRQEFEYLIEAEPPRLVIDGSTHMLVEFPSSGAPSWGVGATS